MKKGVQLDAARPFSLPRTYALATSEAVKDTNDEGQRIASGSRCAIQVGAGIILKRIDAAS